MQSMEKMQLFTNFSSSENANLCKNANFSRHWMTKKIQLVEHASPPPAARTAGERGSLRPVVLVVLDAVGGNDGQRRAFVGPTPEGGGPRRNACGLDGGLPVHNRCPVGHAPRDCPAIVLESLRQKLSALKKKNTWRRGGCRFDPPPLHVFPSFFRTQGEGDSDPPTDPWGSGGGGSRGTTFGG